jgi:carbonic anhydrase
MKPFALAMPAHHLFRLKALVAAAALFAAAPHSLAADRSAEHASAPPARTPAVSASDSAKAVAKPGADKAAPAGAASAPLAAPKEVQAGTLDALREKLAAKLGGAPGPKDARVVRVSTRAGGEFEVAATLPAAPAAKRKKLAVVSKPTIANETHAQHGVPTTAHAHWAYEGVVGPEAWGAMKPEFTTCATGQRQSPIDIRDGIAVDLDPVAFDYRASSFGVIDNGHTVQVNVAPGNAIQVLGRRYELKQFHFHRPSEERIDGRQFDMVAHLVHKDAEGRLAVVAVLLDRGSVQPLVQTVWNNLPLEKGEEVPARARIDLNDLLPKDRRYYTYMGSLTTPPCSEGVLWMVMQQPVPLSEQQIDIFARLYPMNARPVQAASGRLIKQSN